MDKPLFIKNEQVKLVRFCPVSDNPSFKPSSSANITPLSITANGKICLKGIEGPPPLDAEKVKLIGFAFTEALNGSNMNGRANGSNLADPKMDQERQERLARLKKESQEWFSQVRKDNHRWRSSLPNSDVVDSSDKIKGIFAEAEEKLVMGNNDVFSQFMEENQERFAQLLEENDMNSIFSNFPHRPTSMFCDGNPGVFKSEGTFSPPSSRAEAFNKSWNFSSASRTSHTSDSSSTLNGDATSSKTCPLINVQSRTQSTLSHSKSFKGATSHTFSQQPNVFSPSKMPFGLNSDLSSSKAGAKPQPFTSFTTFEDCSPPNFNATSPTKVQIGGSKAGSYQMTSSRSTFEYCGDTNTYRFSTELLTQKFEHGYESISESEDEEEESVDDTASTIGEPSEFDETSIKDVDARSDSGCMLAIEYETKKDKIQQTVYKIANELLTTERTYVAILHLLDQVFGFRVDQENRAHPMFSAEVVSQMFTNVKSIYKLHHDFLLPQLEERMKSWESERRIGDIMKNFAPFLKMYTEYVKNYDNAMSLINLWYQKQSRFAQIMDEIHRMDECAQLTLQHHMLTPVQRVPRYQLLLKDYLKKLPEDSPDKPDTEKALELVSTAANHANETMKKIDKFKKLLEIQEMIGGVMDLVSPTRELLKEGKIIKISARSGDHQERYLFLFNDLLLLCSQRLIANRVVSGPCFRVRARLDVEGLLVEEGDNLETANTFYVRNTGRSIELYTQTPEDKQRWMQALAKAVHDLALRKSSLKVGDQGNASPETPGAKAPTFIKQESVANCMVCGSQFSTFTFKRKHHCHACGIVACTKCLTHKIPLLYDGNKAGRVCAQCYNVLSRSPGDKIDLMDDSPKENRDNPLRRRGVLDVRPTDPAVVNGYLQLKARSRFWVRRWFALLDDFVLYSFNAHGDTMALTSMPVPGYTVGLPEKGDNIDGRENVFKLFHKKKVYYFQTADSTELDRWVNALQKASRAESAS